jgi:signal transduction histidine kinase
MIESVAFQTKARTLDHLGREQIADCPTAISELWKNSFDAYASKVELDIFDGREPVAAIVDDGHGMDRNEFISKWLVVGTESKAGSGFAAIEDRNGLNLRPKQGQKGIGRLSCANLGPLLLLISKRREQDFVAALVDWRLFENPYLNLADVHIPVAVFPKREDLFDQLDGLFDQLMENVWGGKDEAHKLRVLAAWDDYDKMFLDSNPDIAGLADELPSKKIASTLIETAFEARHLSQWPVWTGDADHGTALLISQINYDLRIQLEEHQDDATAIGAKEKFFETLSSFVDPFVDPTRPDISGRDPQFSYSVRVWEGDKERTIVGVGKEFTRAMLDSIEHIIDGIIDSHGVFRGRVKAFGEWRSEDFSIPPPNDLLIPKRSDTLVGPIDFYIAAMEFEANNTTLSKAEYQHFKELAERYGGFMVFRDGLRIMPYGRTDNDFFEIEMRRSLNAGREYWNHRQMFGRLAISRERNPNLKDKAGREGLLDNTAAKTLKILISNILMELARKFFGSSSEYRKELLPDIQSTNKKKKAAEERNKLRRRQRVQFSSKLRNFVKELPQFVVEVERSLNSLSLKNEREVEEAQKMLGEFKDRRATFRLGETPQNLGSLEQVFAQFRESVQHSQSLLVTMEGRIQGAVERLAPAKPRAFAEKQLARNASQIHRRIAGWKKTIDALQRQEFDRIRELVDERNKVFHASVAPLLDRLEQQEISLSEASKIMETVRERMDSENENLFEPYIGALESLQESIDLEHLATFGMDEVNDLRQELDRLNGLAQLGISVEIIGHELESYDEIIKSGLKKLPTEIRGTKAVKDIEFGCDGLTDQLRFLSPLKLSGHRVTSWISGQEIYQYVQEFFAPKFVKAKIEFSATPEFLSFRVFDQPSRLFPVFINLVNNSIYWVGLKDIQPRRIVFQVVTKKVVVSDNGPGVAADDVDSLFSLFFTKKLRGGRGVGLFLCRANLAAGGHKISYGSGGGEPPLLPGANFIIDFRGAEYAE